MTKYQEKPPVVLAEQFDAKKYQGVDSDGKPKVDPQALRNGKIQWNSFVVGQDSSGPHANVNGQLIGDGEWLVIRNGAPLVLTNDEFKSQYDTITTPASPAN